MNTKPKSLTIEQINARLDVMEQNILQMYRQLDDAKNQIDKLKAEK
jgi:hypothetical protein